MPTLQAAETFDDTELVARAPVLLAREISARASVAAIPVSPATSSFIALKAAPTSPDARGAPAAHFGQLLISPPVIFTPHVHTLHCEPACVLHFDPHRHSAACNHDKSKYQKVFFAARCGDAAGVRVAIDDGGSTEEADRVSERWEWGGEGRRRT